MPTKKVSLAFVITLAIAAAVVGAAVRYLQDTRANAAPQSRPEFSLPDLQNKQHSIAEWDGKLVLINFWASWCPPCIKEMPALDRIRLEYQNQNFEIIGITAEPAKDANLYLANNPVSYPILNGEASASSLGQQYGNTIGSIPYNVLIDRHGLIQRRYYGEIDLADLKNDISTFSELIN